METRKAVDMVEQERLWFRNLSELRNSFHEATLNNSYDEIWTTISSPYSDEAHFANELLQNADDCGASECEFELYQDRLVFMHNGSEHFTVSNPSRESVSDDSRNGRLGHVNAITGVSNSTKDGNKIGKFGIGFKSVFLYTDTPMIYDDNICFKIHDYIIPELLDEDYHDRKAGWTVFVFPFNKRQNAPSDPVGAIDKRLQRLTFPTFFLNNLRKISWKHGPLSGSYSKEVREEVSVSVENTQMEFIDLKKVVCTSITSSETVDSFLVFTRKDIGPHAYSIAFGLNGDKIKPISYSPFCFFPTKVQLADIKFVFHAPFMLTSDRSNLSEANELHREVNQKLLNKLAQLLADSIEMMKDYSLASGKRILEQGIITERIVPLTSPDHNWDYLNLDPFVESVRRVFQEKPVIPCESGYCSKSHAWAAEQEHITKAFDDVFLQGVVGDPQARWIFKGVSIYEGHIREDARDRIVRPYIVGLTALNRAFTAADIMSRVEGRFIENKLINLAWCDKFYRWVANIPSRELFNDSREYALLINQHGNSVVADSIYLPPDGETTFDVVHPDLHQLESVQKLEKAYGLRMPNLADLIKEYAEKAAGSDLEISDAAVDWLVKKACASDVTAEDRELIISKLSNPKIGYRTLAEDSTVRMPATRLFLDSDIIRKMLSSVNEDEGRYIINADYYRELCGTGAESLFHELRITAYPRLQDRKLTVEQARGYCRSGLLEEKFDKYENLGISEEHLVGVEELFAHQEYEVILEVLSSLLEHYPSLEFSKFAGTYTYREKWGRTSQKRIFGSVLAQLLRNTAWLQCKDGQCRKPNEVTTADLGDFFAALPERVRVAALLGIREAAAVAAEINKAIEDLPEAERRAISLGRLAINAGANSEDDIKRAFELLQQEKAKEAVDPAPHTPTSTEPPKDTNLTDIRKKVKEVVRKTKEYKEQNQISEPKNISADADVMQPKVVDISQKIEEVQRRMEQEIEELKKDAELQETAVTSEEYSYAWLKSRIDIEIREAGASDADHGEAVVTFSKMERDPSGDNMFVLSATSDVIPQWFEEEVNQRLTISIPGRNDIETVIESMSVLSFKIRAKVRILPGMENIDYSTVVRAKTSATRPDFLMNSLREGYEALNLEDTFNLKANLPEDIKFIFGPPGTGKTTHLAKNEIIPLAKSAEHPHILVLTPTNKAADVLTNRIIKECGDDSYTDWLSRFGLTLDQSLRSDPVARSKDVDIRNGESAVVVSTIIRFAYDAFTSMDKIALKDFKWDYIVIDEASMIPLMQILYPIYKAKGAKFIIAGDPMQIAPVIRSDLSVGQNIYTMVGLTDFAEPKTEPRPYEVVRLTKQYRSVPCVGRIFSQFAYCGLLEHNRTAAEEQILELTGLPEFKPLTVLKFPVSPFESIFKVKHLGSSSYQIYSALFVFEMVCKIAVGLRESGRDGFRIGIISPYRAQADIVGRLIARATDDMLRGVEIQVGTVHSFQGDECEMIIALLNPPSGMGRGEGSFINNTKVLNVAISRARDYLVLALPDDNTRNVQFLSGPNRVAELMKSEGDKCGELFSPNLETFVFGDRDYIEKNTYSTGHQSVNVYETPEKRFEVRSENDAVDIHFRADRSVVSPNDSEFVSERERIEVSNVADNAVRERFEIPVGFHRPAKGETVPWMKLYYVIGRPEPLECEDETSDIDPSTILAIED